MGEILHKVSPHQSVKKLAKEGDRYSGKKLVASNNP